MDYDKLKKQLKEVKKILDDGRVLRISDADALRYQDILTLLESRGYIFNLNIDDVNWYRVMGDLNDFEEWLNEEIKETKRVTRREWIIGIVCAVVGAAIGLIPYIVSLFAK